MSINLARTAEAWWVVTPAGLVRLGLPAATTAALLAGRAALAAAIEAAQAAAAAAPQDAVPADSLDLLSPVTAPARVVAQAVNYRLVLVRISSTSGTGTPAGPGAGEDADWIDVRLAGERRPAGLRALAVLGSNPALTVIVRPDRVIAAVEPRCRLPHLPWYVPATAGRGSPATACRAGKL